jgi:hypothetical protein
MIAVMLSAAASDLSANSPLVANEPLSEHYNDSIVVEKQFTSKKHKIRLYPNATQQVLFFSASGEEGIIYQLFLFDIDGHLVKQANIKNKQTTVININEKGIYLFEVFIEDKRIESGKVMVR